MDIFGNGWQCVVQHLLGENKQLVRDQLLMFLRGPASLNGRRNIINDTKKHKKQNKIIANY